MTLGARFETQDPKFAPFLFASLGDEESGMALTGKSALARLGTDPWQEAGRLADLPRATATEALTAIIEKIPGRWSASEAAALAASLVQFLPKAGSPATPVSIGGVLPQVPKRLLQLGICDLPAARCGECPLAARVTHDFVHGFRRFLAL